MASRLRSLFVVGALVATTAVGAAGPVTSRALVAPLPLAHWLAGPSHWLQPPNTKMCKQQTGFKCYAPFQMQNAYDLNPLYEPCKS